MKIKTPPPSPRNKNPVENAVKKTSIEKTSPDEPPLLLGAGDMEGGGDDSLRERLESSGSSTSESRSGTPSSQGYKGRTLSAQFIPKDRSNTADLEMQEHLVFRAIFDAKLAHLKVMVEPAKVTTIPFPVDAKNKDGLTLLMTANQEWVSVVNLIENDQDLHEKIMNIRAKGESVEGLGELLSKSDLKNLMIKKDNLLRIGTYLLSKGADISSLERDTDGANEFLSACQREPLAYQRDNIHELKSPKVKTRSVIKKS
jgi:hypothetical protein